MKAINAHVPRSALELATDTVHRLASQPDPQDGQDAAFRAELLRRYQSLRRFMPVLLEAISFEAAPGGQAVLDAMESLRALEARAGRVSAATVSLNVVGGRWRRLVLANPQLGENEVDRRAYAFCVLEALQAALNQRDVFVARSGRFTDPRAKLLQGPAWTATRPEICAGLSLDPAPQRALEQLSAQLDYSDQIFACSGSSATNSAPAQPDYPTNGSGALTATPTTARSIDSPHTASTSS